MSSSQFKILLGGLAVLLAMLACSTASLAIPAIPTIPAIQVATDTASPLPATAAPAVPAATDTASPVPATSTPTVPPLPVVSSPSIQSLDMLDLNNGWAMTDTGVVRTSDGGATWHEATPAGLNGAPASPFFLNSTTAWLAVGANNPNSGTLYHTTDGGASWTSTTVPFGGGSINFTDPMNGWELIELSAAMSHEAVAIFRTSDGGTTWSRVYINDPGVSGYSSSLPLVGDKNGIIALDTNHAWVSGAQPSSDFIYIYASQDGGTTWVGCYASSPAPGRRYPGHC